MNRKLFKLPITIVTESNQFTRYSSIYQIQTVSEKPLGPLCTSIKCHKFHDSMSQVARASTENRRRILSDILVSHIHTKIKEMMKLANREASLPDLDKIKAHTNSAQRFVM